MTGFLFRRFGEPGGALALFAGYFLLQWLVRLLIGGGLELDEAEQVVFAQRLQPGYSHDPPLYTWLQIPLFKLFGTGVAALSLLKNMLLFTTFAGSYFIGRHVGLSPERAGLAALSLILLPQVGWESQRDLTHSVLVTAVAALTLWSVLALLNGARGIGQYLLLGLLAGLGMLSKFNYALFLLVLLIALGSLRPRLLFRPVILAALSVCAVVVAPFIWWTVNNLALATATSYKLEIGGDYWAGLAAGLGSLTVAYIAFGGLFLLVFVVIFLPWRQAEGRFPRADRTPGTQLLTRMFWTTPAVMIGYLLLSGGAVYRDRWLLPLLFYLPVLFFAWLPDEWIDKHRLTRLKRILSAMLLLIPAGLLARTYLYPYWGEYTKPNFPGAALAGALTAQAGEFETVVAESSYLGGNLKPYLGGHLVGSPTVDFPIDETGEPLLLIWNGRASPTRPPEKLTYYLQQAGLSPIPVGSPTLVTKPYRFATDHSYTLAWQFWR